MGVEKPKADVDNTARRKWDKEDFSEKASKREKEEQEGAELDWREAKRQKRLARDPLHQGLIQERGSIKARDYKLNLDSRRGKSQIVGAVGGLSQQPGYYCSVCDCVLKDNLAYLDHINGKGHNRALGLNNNKVEKSSASAVKDRMAELKRKKEQAKAQSDAVDEMEARIQSRRDAEEAERRRKKEAAKQKKVNNNLHDNGDDDDDNDDTGDLTAAALGTDPEIAKMMGFTGFGGM